MCLSASLGAGVNLHGFFGQLRPHGFEWSLHLFVEPVQSRTLCQSAVQA